MKKKFVILNYGVGNYRSILNFFSYFNSDLKISADTEVIKNCDILILPGVGNYQAVMSFLHQKNLDTVIQQHIASDRVVLGICIGMHILGRSSEESPGVNGLGVLDFDVVYRKVGCHIGWRSVTFDNWLGYEGINQKSFYFNHSYKIFKTKADCVFTNGTEKIPSIVRKNKVFGFQFHPEKSQNNGKILISHILKKELSIC